MANRPKYKTKQKEMVLEYLIAVEGRHVTAAEVCEYFTGSGISIGQSTVYRQLENLVNEGVVNKYIIDGKSPACFEYVGRGENCHQDVCFHCKCEKCGKLIHLHCEDLKGLGEHLYTHHQFALDTSRTVFYGVCEDCAGMGE